jgi:hypothetical protein
LCVFTKCSHTPEFHLFSTQFHILNVDEIAAAGQIPIPLSLEAFKNHFFNIEW